MVGAETYCTVCHSGLTSMVVGRILRQTSRAKARNDPSSGVVRVKDGATNCTPQRTRMCGSGVARQMRRKGRSTSGKVTSLSNHDLVDFPYFSSMSENSAGKALSQESSRPKAPSATGVSGGVACWSCLPKSSGGGRV